MINYLLEFATIHSILFLGYWLLLKKERQYAKMRSYLLISSLLALVIPFLKLPKLFVTEKVITPMSVQVLPLEIVPASPEPVPTFGVYDLLFWSYLVVSSYFFIRFLWSILYLVLLESRSIRSFANGLVIRRAPNVKASFTFFNWIFVDESLDSSSKDFEIILKHESAHAAFGHTFDILILELFKVFFWWVPSIWLIIKEIKIIHEYQADAYALKSYDIEQYSSILISSVLKTNGLSLASSFHNRLIIKRLIAMKQQARFVSPWKIWALGTLGVSLFLTFACSEELRTTNVLKTTDVPDEVFTVVEELPEFDGGMEAFYQYVGNEIKYPAQAQQKGVEGQVYVQFVVERDGAITHVEAIKGIGSGCEEEAVRVVKNAPAFNPGKQRGRTVRVRMEMPIRFTLEKEAGLAGSQSQLKGTILAKDLQIKPDQLKIEANYADGVWSGTIHDKDGKALPGASIVVAETTKGTVSDLDGMFKVTADEAQELYVSFVGYETVRLVGNK